MTLWPGEMWDPEAGVTGLCGRSGSGLGSELGSGAGLELGSGHAVEGWDDKGFVKPGGRRLRLSCQD